MEIAANGVAQSFWSMAALFCMAFDYAFVTVTGQYMGAGDAEAADYYNIWAHKGHIGVRHNAEQGRFAIPDLA